MNELEQEKISTIGIYRELFLKANEEIKKQLHFLKTSNYCNNCNSCCKLRYSELSPKEILALNKQEKDFTTGNYLELFLPYGAKSFEEEVDRETNNALAKLMDEEFVKKVADYYNDNVYFYYCKHLENNVCQKNYNSALICSGYPNDVKTILPSCCGYKEWKLKSLDKLENEISRDICQRIQQIEDHKQNYSCSKCATCCNLACSEFSPEELEEKAKNNDKFAMQFTSVFIPYKNQTEARKVYPEYIDHLEKELKEGEKVYFYHCPKLGKDKLCTDYKNRPPICREFPTNPLILLPKSCGYYQWREDVHIGALMLHALVEIVKFNIEQIKKTI